MAVLERSELEASPLADLHAIADQLGLDGFRRLRKEALIAAILDEPEGATAPKAAVGEEDEEEEDAERSDAAPRQRRRRPARSRRSSSAGGEDDEAPARPDAPRQRTGRAGGGRSEGAGLSEEVPARTAEGVVEVLGNGSAFLRVE